MIDAISGSHIWAERYDRELKEIFAVQDELVGTIVGTLVGRVKAIGAEQARRRPPTSLAAYECVLRGHALPWGDPDSDAEAKRLYEKAIELDPGYGLAHAKLALMMLHEWFISGSDATLDRAFELANKAVLLDENESYCQLMLGYVHLFRRSFDLAEQYHRRALEMNPNNPEHLADLGGLLIYLGQPNEAFDFLNTGQARRSLLRPQLVLGSGRTGASFRTPLPGSNRGIPAGIIEDSLDPCQHRCLSCASRRAGACPGAHAGSASP